MLKRLLLVLAVCVTAVGCGSRPIMNVDNAPVVGPTGRSLTVAQVQDAIVAAGTKLGWAMSPVRPGLLSGRIVLRTHTAIIDVAYDAKQYSIRYKDSVNLNAGDGNIHKNYNGWIENLDKGIRAELLRL